jgi:hypothetical protein
MSCSIQYTPIETIKSVCVCLCVCLLIKNVRSCSEVSLRHKLPPATLSPAERIWPPSPGKKKTKKTKKPKD